MARRARIPVGGAVAALAVALSMPGAAGQTSSPTLSPARLDFGTVEAGQRSEPEQFTFVSTTPVTVDAVSVTGEFTRAGGTCGPGVSVGSTGCTVLVVFAPATAGAKTGTVTVVYGLDNSRESVLSGTGTPPATTTTEPPPTTAPPDTEPPPTAPPRPTTSARPPVQTTRPGTTLLPPTTVVPVPGDVTPDTVPETTTTTSTTPAAPPPLEPAGFSRPPPGVTLDAVTAAGRRSGPPGIGLTVSGTGYPPAGTRALGVRHLAAPDLAQAGPSCETVYVFVDGRRVGSTDPDEGGQIRKDGISVPGDTPPGTYDVSASCSTSGEPVLAAATFEVTGAGVHRSPLATSLPQADQVDFGLEELLFSALAVAGLLVLIAFPAELFNTTLEEHYDEVRRWFRLRPRSIGGGRHHGAVLVAFLLLSGPLWFAMQPSSGFDAATALGALGLSLATAVVVFASDMPSVVHVRRRYRERATPIALPGALLIGIGCVVLSRAVHFQPGYFYGLVGGLALSRSLARDESGRLAARTAALLLGLSVVTWLAMMPVSAAAAESGRTLGIILVENILAGIFWAALDSLVIAMLPLRLLEGAKVVGWSRAAWAGLYAVTLLAFVHILLRPSTGYVSNTSVSPTNVVIGLFVGFAVFSFAFWGYFRFRPSRSGEPPADEVQRAPGTEPLDVFVGQGVGALEVNGGTVGAVETAVDRPVGGQAPQSQDRDAV